MKKLLELSRYTAWLGVASLLVASVAAFVWGALKTAKVVGVVFASQGADPAIAVQLVALLDAFLIALALMFFAFSLYELTLGDLDVPDGLVVRSLDQLKSKLSSLLVMVMAVGFVERLVAWEDPRGTALFALAVALVSAVLVAFTRLAHGEPHPGP